MYNMTWNIQVGNYKLNMISSLEINRSVELLADTAEIRLPGAVYNKTLTIEEKIKIGDPVSIELGYNNQFVPEFSGYLVSINTDNDTIVLNCEDAIYLYRVPISNREIAPASVKNILTLVNSEVSKAYPDRQPFTLNCDYDFSYDKFVINNTTGYDILKKLQDEAKPNIYLKDSVLHVHPQYVEIFGSAKYDFALNIEKSTLKYKNAEDRKILVEVEAAGADGKIIKQQAGTPGGDKISLKIDAANVDGLKQLAEQELSKHVYTGYEGSFDTWLVPYCDAGYKIYLRDRDYDIKNGWYYVLGVKTSFSDAGAKRVITIGKKLSNG